MREGWVCPKCGRVWNPGWMSCDDCNRDVGSKVRYLLDHPECLTVTDEIVTIPPKDVENKQVP